MAATSRRTVSRRELAHDPRFEQVSPEVGRLDEDAFDELYELDPDAALALLAEAGSASDRALRLLARRLAARVAIRLNRGGSPRTQGMGRRRRVPMDQAQDLDLDASTDALLAGAYDQLVGTAWRRTSLALCLVVDRSGSVGGDRLATAALAAAAVAARAPDDHAVAVFSDRAVVVRRQDRPRPTDAVIDDLLALRGHGTTDLAAALDTARAQLARSRATRKLTVLLSDCRPTAGPDPLPYARRLDELVVVAPADDGDEAAAFARRAGGRFVTVAGPSDVPRALGFLADG